MVRFGLPEAFRDRIVQKQAFSTAAPGAAVEMVRFGLPEAFRDRISAKTGLFDRSARSCGRKCLFFRPGRAGPGKLLNQNSDLLEQNSDLLDQNSDLF